MFRAIILPIFRSTRLCVTACGIMHPRCCRPPAEGEHVNRGRDTPSFCPTLQVLDMSTLGDAADVNPVIKFLPHTCNVQPITTNSCDKIKGWWDRWLIEWKFMDLSVWLKTGTNVEILRTRKWTSGFVKCWLVKDLFACQNGLCLAELYI